MCRWRRAGSHTLRILAALQAQSPALFLDRIKRGWWRLRGMAIIHALNPTRL